MVKWVQKEVKQTVAQTAECLDSPDIHAGVFPVLPESADGAFFNPHVNGTEFLECCPLAGDETRSFPINTPLATAREMGRYGLNGKLVAVLSIGGSNQRRNLLITRRIDSVALIDIDSHKGTGTIELPMGEEIIVGRTPKMDAGFGSEFPVHVAKHHLSLRLEKAGIVVRNMLPRTNAVVVSTATETLPDLRQRQHLLKTIGSVSLTAHYKATIDWHNCSHFLAALRHPQPTLEQEQVA